MLDSSGFEDTLRPDAVTTGSQRVGIPEPSVHTFKRANSRVIRPNRALLGALECVMYRAQWVLIDRENHGIVIDSLDAARAAIASGTAASAGGRLADGLLGADIDAEDALVGDACAEALIAWCGRHQIPYLLRDSGRPGGRHVIAVVTHSAVPVEQWNKLCRELSNRHKVVVDDRTGRVLRLLTAPHRIGLPSPVLSCTITPSDVLDAPKGQLPRTVKHRLASDRPKARPSAQPGDRSAYEFGVACAMARRDYTGKHAYTELVALDGKTAERSKRWFQRYLWIPAIATVSAERGLDHDSAWKLAQRDCGAECDRLGIVWWRGLWERAVSEAKTTRPRRHRLPDEVPADPNTLDQDQLAATRAGLAAAVDSLLGGIDPRRRHSVHVVLHALAVALVGREGSMSLRDLSLRSLIDLKTARRAIGTAVEHGILVVTHHYGGGATDCTAYGVGPSAAQHINAASSGSSPTSCSTPAPTGRCHPARLHGRYARERRIWSLRCDALSTLAPGERLATSQHPTAKLLRSLWYQRKWWVSMTSDEQDQRRTERKGVLGKLSRSERTAWFNWLSRRETIVAAAAALKAKPGHSLPAQAERALRQAPLTVHRGMRDPLWRAGGTPLCGSRGEDAPQLRLAAA